MKPEPNWGDRESVRAYFAGIRREIDEIVRAMPPATRSAWSALLEQHEFFDGEPEITLDMLRRFLRSRRGERPVCRSCGERFDPLVKTVFSSTSRFHFHTEQ